MSKNIYIVGAHSRARTLAAYLRYLHPDIVIAAYLYDNGDENPERIDGVEVVRMDGKADLCVDSPVYIATRGVHHGHITEKLKGMGFREIRPVTVELDIWLRNAYLEKYYAGIGRNFPRIDRFRDVNVPGGGKMIQNCESVRIYVVKSAQDTLLRQAYAMQPYEGEIQAGAALRDVWDRKSAVMDDTGDNISRKNRQFCELTALYWIWKNARENIIGLVHYRRHFILSGDWLGRMLANRVDVILPVPLYVAPNLDENFRERHGAVEWDCMMECLKKRDRQEYLVAREFFQGNLYSPCNMLIARRQVLDELCEWLFPILFWVAGQIGEKEDAYQNRYPGFLSERLISFFFERHRSTYRIAYCDKNFLE